MSSSVRYSVLCPGVVRVLVDRSIGTEGRRSCYFLVKQKRFVGSDAITISSDLPESVLSTSVDVCSEVCTYVRR